MTPVQKAALYQSAFPYARAWTVSEITALLDRPEVLFVTQGEDGFALLQLVPPEAEILTLLISPSAQGHGLGKALLAQVIETALENGAPRIFLEVGANNRAARALYARAGFEEIGRRRDYYHHGNGLKEDALILSRSAGALKPGVALEN